MALALLDGTTAASDISVGGQSIKCVLNSIRADIVRDMFEKTTFCSGGWRSRTPGMKQLLFGGVGYAHKGQPHSDPLDYVSSTTGEAWVITIDTGCTLTFTGHSTLVHLGVNAAANSEFAVSGESDGAVTSAWVEA